MTIPLFGGTDGSAAGMRDVLEGRFISLALELVRVGTNVVLDFGCWTRAERAALRWLVSSYGNDFELIYLPVDRDTQLQRIAARWTSTPGQTYPMTPEDLDQWRAVFEEPGDRELAGWEEEPPAPYSSWLGWAQRRWPSLAEPV